MSWFSENYDFDKINGDVFLEELQTLNDNLRELIDILKTKGDMG